MEASAARREAEDAHREAREARLEAVAAHEENIRTNRDASRVATYLGRVVRLKDALANYLDAWRATLAARGTHASAVFLSVRGSRITRQAVHALVERYGRHVGIEGRSEEHTSELQSQ